MAPLGGRCNRIIRDDRLLRQKGVGDFVSKVTLQEIIAEFGQNAKAKLDNNAAIGQPEDQLRGPLETLFGKLSQLCGHAAGTTVLVGETSLSDLKTRPDYSVTHGIGATKALIGFIELKAPGKGSDPRRFNDAHDKDQWKRLKALPNLLYTDGNGLSIWRNGQLVGEVIHFDGDIRTSGKSLAAPAKVEAAINGFLAWQPVAPKSATELADVSARLCRFLRDEVVEQMELGDSVLGDLAEDWRILLFPDASDAQFADGYAQAVTFGMLMAKSLGLSLQDDLDTVGKKLGQSNTLIGTALRLLTDNPETLKVSLSTMQRVLDVVDWGQVSKAEPEAWLYFYEQFLKSYDSRLRRLTGSYYTPPQVVKAMVRLCDEALKSPSRYNLSKGLAADQVSIVDPAMGSGTYLLAVVRHIAEVIAAEQGPGAVLAAMKKAVARLYGFELQFGAFAVAQLRLLAEMIEIAKLSLGPKAAIDEAALVTPHMFVTDTLGDPFADFESGQGIYKEISRSRIEANKVKREQKITVVIGNPPYKEKAKGRGAWVENGSGNRAALLNDWQPPKAWKVGVHSKHLRNLYVYFWRWAAWKVFQQGEGKRDLEPPQEEQYAGIVCFITVSGYLNGPGFQKMRADLRRDCDEIWIIDCSPEGHQPSVQTRIFQGVQHPVCIVLSSRSPDNDPEKAAKVRYRSLAKGNRLKKFEELAELTLSATGWANCPEDWRGPFLPELQDQWSKFVPLDTLLNDSGSGVMPGRTWIYAPDRKTLERRWARLVTEKNEDIRTELFHPHLRDGQPGDRHIKRPSTKSLGTHHDKVESVEFGVLNAQSANVETAAAAQKALKLVEPVRYGFHTFDRHWLIPDLRLINQANPSLWEGFGESQVYIAALASASPKSGPAISFSGLIPDINFYRGFGGGRVFPLWQDAAATKSSVGDATMRAIAKTYGAAPSGEDVFAYVAALLANPAYTRRFSEDLVRPGLRVPLTADRTLFNKASALGREIIWLHTFGERFADPSADMPRPFGPPRTPMSQRPTIAAGMAIPDDPANFPDTIDYDPADCHLKIGSGCINNVPLEVWNYEVSGKNVLRQWFSYRKKNRERPTIGDRREASALGDIQPDHWLPEYTEELLDLLNVLALLVSKEAEQAALLDDICDGPLIEASQIQALEASMNANKIGLGA